MKIADFVGVGLRKLRVRRLDIGEAIPVACLDLQLLRGGDGIFRQFGRIEEQLRIAAGQHDDQLVDIGFPAAKAGRQRQRHWPEPGVNGAKKAGREFRAGFGDQRKPVALLEAQGEKAAGMTQRILAQFGIGIGTQERGTRVVKIHSTIAFGRIVQRFAQRGEVGDPARLAVQRRRIARRREMAIDRVVAVEHA